MTFGSARSEPLLSLQAGRAIAALAVVLTHACDMTEKFVGPIPGIVREPLYLGQLGVDFFFVLSGFIILYSHWNDDRPLRYARKRLTRVFVPYLPISIALVMVYLTSLAPLFVGVEPAPVWGIAPSIFLLPSEKNPALTPAWTLIHELAFYALFTSYFFLRRRHFVVLVCLWAAAIGAYAALKLGVSTVTPGTATAAATVLQQNFMLATAKNIASNLLQPINIEFILGMACVVVSRRIDRARGPAILATGVVLALVAMFLCSRFDAPRELFGIAMAVTVVGLVLMDATMRIPKGLLFLGAASYAIYLAHYPVIVFASKVAPGMGWVLSLASLTALGLSAGILYHLWVEKPILRLFRR